MKRLDAFLKAQKDVYSYFDYKEDWHVYPIDDRREYKWQFNDDICPTEVLYYDLGDEEEYSDTVLTDRFLDKAIWDGEDYTMVLVDTHTDGNKFLAIYDNAKRIREENSAQTEPFVVK